MAEAPNAIGTLWRLFLCEIVAALEREFEVAADSAAALTPQERIAELAEILPGRVVEVERERVSLDQARVLARRWLPFRTFDCSARL